MPCCVRGKRCYFFVSRVLVYFCLRLLRLRLSPVRPLHTVVKTPAHTSSSSSCSKNVGFAAKNLTVKIVLARGKFLCLRSCGFELLISEVVSHFYESVCEIQRSRGGKREREEQKKRRKVECGKFAIYPSYPLHTSSRPVGISSIVNSYNPQIFHL